MCLICAGSFTGVSCLKIVLEFRLLVLFYYVETFYFNMGDAVPDGDDDDDDTSMNEDINECVYRIFEALIYDYARDKAKKMPGEVLNYKLAEA